MPLRLLLLQILPIIIFIVVDSVVQDPAWAIGCALAFVGVHALLLFIRQRRFDRFVVIDVLLVGGLGGVSLLLHDEVFFKLKPAILEVVMVPLVLFLALASEGVVQSYLGRYSIGAVKPNPAQLPLLRRLLVAMAALLLIHAGVTVWAALSWSRQAWAWISGPGFYALLLPIVGWALLLRLRARRAQRAGSAASLSRTRVSGRRKPRGG